MPHECTTCGRTFPDGSKEMLSGCPDCGGNKFQFHPAGKGASGSDTSVDDAPGRDTVDGTPGPDTSVDGTLGRDASNEASSNAGPVDDTGASDSSFSFGASRSDDAEVTTGTGAEEADASPATADDADASPSTTEEPSSPPEDRAQASARRAFVSDDEIARADDVDASDGEGSAGPPGPESSSVTSSAGPAEGATHSTDETEPPTDGTPSPDETEPADLAELREELNDQFESIKIHARGEYELNLMELYDREEHIIALEEDGRYVIDVPSSWRDPEEDA